MKQIIIVLFLTILPYLTFSQASNMKFQSKEDLTVKPTSVSTLEAKINEEPPKPGDEDFVVKMYSYLEKVMDAKVIILEANIDKDYSERILKKKDEMMNESDNDNIRRLTKEIESLENDMKKEKREVVGYIEGLKKEYNFKSRTDGFVFVLSKNRRVKNGYDAQVYYNQSINEKSARFLSNSIINIGGNGEKISLYNEIYSDFFGPLRVGVGALVSNKISNGDSIETQKDAVQRLLGGGGNGVINISYPLIGYISPNNRFNIKSSLNPKIAIDVPKLGTESSSFGFNYDLGIEATVFYSGLLDVLTLYSNCRIACINGNSVFFNNLGKEKSSFILNQLSFGIALNSTFRLSWSYYFGSKYVNDNFPSTISFSIIPN